MGEAEAQLQSRAFDVWLTAVHSRPGPGCMSHPPASEFHKSSMDSLMEPALVVAPEQAAKECTVCMDWT